MSMNINWYPGHMKKTKDSIRENLKLVNIVFELIDARIPFSSSNPLLQDILGDKPKIKIINKYDLANPDKTKQWQNYFESHGESTVLVNAASGHGVKELKKMAKEIMRPQFEKAKERGIQSTTIKAMIVGVPNVGKSTLINNLAGKKSLKTGNKPGITRQNQWLRVEKSFQLLDTPGILWPKFETEDIALNLAFTAAIKDEILDTETLALRLIEKLNRIDKNILINRYNIAEYENGLDSMEAIARKRGAILRGAEIDYTKTANIVLDEFRKGILGNITLEDVNDVL
ncbi:MAG: ribosome biogenesis GTPase YlqF [Tissierellia bacterium]|nr:ribosome biogenesis GTPase YlqF [Tissierellia bacterium]